jgi:hypothetical protein
VKNVKKSFFLLLLLAFFSLAFCGCGKDETEYITEWPADAFDFMAGVPQFSGEQYNAAISEDYETVSVYYKGVSLDRVYAYVEQLKLFGLEENVATEVKDGKYHWISALKEGELFAEVMWYDTEYELESGEYKYSLVIKFAEF